MAEEGKKQIIQAQREKELFFPYKNNYTLPTTGGASTTPISQNLGCERWDFLSVFPPFRDSVTPASQLKSKELPGKEGASLL